jgi:hypothetical protein
MSTSPAKEIERNRGATGGQTHASVPSANDFRGNGEIRSVAVSKRHMRVRLCSRCPYTPRDLAGHYDPDGILHACAKCDGHEASTNHYPRKAQRRQQCATVPAIYVTAQPIVARSATEGLASSATTPGKPPSVQGSALTVSRAAGKATADGCVAFKRPDNGWDENPAAFFPKSMIPGHGDRPTEAVQ